MIGRREAFGGAGPDAAAFAVTLLMKNGVVQKIAGNAGAVGEVGRKVHHGHPAMAGSGVYGEKNDGDSGPLGAFDQGAVDIVLFGEIELKHGERGGAGRGAEAWTEVVAVGDDSLSGCF